MNTTRLLGDLGATHVRFALLTPDGSMSEPVVFQSGDYETLVAAIEAYLSDMPAELLPEEAGFAVAAPVLGDKILMTNGPWNFSIEETRRQFGWKMLHVVNDFAANASAIPELRADDVRQVGEGKPAPAAAIAVLGPGTGLGVAGLVYADGRYIIVAGEGGHTTLAPMESRESAIIDILHRQYGHVSAERVLSGPGLVNLYDCLCELAGKPAAATTPEHITNLYPGCDPQCREAVNLFCAMLGTFAGNVALTLGARGGVYIMGGIVPKMYEIFRHSQFRERFEFKGRYKRYMGPIPTYVVMHPYPALLGLKALFNSDGLKNVPLC